PATLLPPLRRNTVHGGAVTVAQAADARGARRCADAETRGWGRSGVSSRSGAGPARRAHWRRSSATDDRVLPWGAAVFGCACLSRGCGLTAWRDVWHRAEPGRFPHW